MISNGTDLPVLRWQTDPAREFARLAQFLLKIQGNSQHSSYKLLKNSINGGKHGGAILRAYSIGSKRVEDLALMVSQIDDDDIDEDSRAAAMAAVYGIGKVFNPEYYSREWNSVVSECLPKEHLLALAFLSPIMARHYPLPVVQPEEIDALVARLSEASEELLADTALPPWAQMPLSRGIDDLLFILQNFVLFGHDEAVSRILTLITTANHAVAAANKSGAPQVRLVGLCVALALAVDVFAAAPNISQAYATYRGWMVDAVEVMKPLLTPPPLRLEGPKQTDDDEIEDV